MKLDLLASDYMQHGMSPSEARAAARCEFGGVDQITEQYRDQRSFPRLDTFLRDLSTAPRECHPLRTVAPVDALARGSCRAARNQHEPGVDVDYGDSLDLVVETWDKTVVRVLNEVVRQAPGHSWLVVTSDSDNNPRRWSV